MNISYVIKDSFQEYHDFQSIVLFCQGCNYNCLRCYNIDVVKEKIYIGKAKDILRKEVNPLHEAVVFLGGEPTIWGDKLVDAASMVKNELGLKVKVFTNGSHPEVVQKLIDYKVVDFFSVDFKCVNNCKKILGIDINDDKYINLVTNTAKIIQKAYPIGLEFRTTDLIGSGNILLVREYINKNFPGVSHIIQKEFLIPALSVA